jgi:hypothetical protein
MAWWCWKIILWIKISYLKSMTVIIKFFVIPRFLMQQSETMKNFVFNEKKMKKLFWEKTWMKIDVWRRKTNVENFWWIFPSILTFSELLTIFFCFHFHTRMHSNQWWSLEDIFSSVKRAFVYLHVTELSLFVCWYKIVTKTFPCFIRMYEKWGVHEIFSWLNKFRHLISSHSNKIFCLSNNKILGLKGQKTWLTKFIWTPTKK